MARASTLYPYHIRLDIVCDFGYCTIVIDLALVFFSRLIGTLLTSIKMKYVYVLYLAWEEKKALEQPCFLILRFK